MTVVEAQTGVGVLPGLLAAVDALAGVVAAGGAGARWGEDSDRVGAEPRAGVGGGVDASTALSVNAGTGLWRLSDAEVVEGLASVGRLRQLLTVAEVALAGEGVGRGLPGESAWSAVDWVVGCESRGAPAPEVGHAARVVRVAGGGCPAPVREAFDRGDLPLGKADQLARFQAEVGRVADPGQVADDLAVLLSAARDEEICTGPGGRVRERVAGLSGPVAGPDGERDPGSAAHRRADAGGGGGAAGGERAGGGGAV